MSSFDMEEHESSGRDAADKVLDQYFRALSDTEAPASLIPRVQAAIAARALRPWWQQSYQSWNHKTRTLVLSVAGGMLLLLSWLLPIYLPAISGGGGFGLMTPYSSSLEPLWAVAMLLVGSLQAFLSQVPATVYYLVAAIIWVGYLLAVGTGVFLCRLVQLQKAR